MNASVVVGQSTFSGSSSNEGGSPNSRNVNYTQGVATDGQKLIISDCSNNRVLIYNSIPTTNGAAADVVLGQVDFTHNQANQGGTTTARTISCPEGITVYGGKLFISDVANNRVLIYNSIPTVSNTAADLVIGQTNMTSNSAGTTADKIDQPSAVNVDPVTGKLFVSDWGNARVMVFNSIPTSNGASADYVIGKPDFATTTLGVSQSITRQPYAAKVFEKRLVLADTNNARVLIFNTIPTTSGPLANIVWGQDDFTSNQANKGGAVGPLTTAVVTDVAYDGIRFFILDSTNSRILVFDGIPTSSSSMPIQVIGQADFTHAQANQGGSPAANTLSDYSDIGLETINNQLFVSDSDNNRVLIYNNVTTPINGSVSKETAIDSALFRWTTSTPGTSYVVYGPTTSYGSHSTLYDRNPRVTSHTVRLTGLPSCTTYHYQVISTDSNLQDQVSTDDTFTTDCYPNYDRQVDTGIHGAPSCNSEKPGSAPNLFQITTNGTSATLYIAPGSMPYNKFFIAYGQGTVTEQYGVEFESNFSGGVLPFTINSLAKNTKYSFKVRAGNGCQTGDWSSALSAKTTSSVNTKRIFTPFSK